MRKGIKYITSVLCGVSMLYAQTAGAETILGYDSAAGRLDISGSLDDTASAYVTFSVLPASVNPESLNEGSPALERSIYKTVPAKAGAAFDEEVVLPGDFAPGEYALRTFGSEAEGICRFMVISGSPSPAELAPVNSAASGAEMLTALRALEKIPFDGATLDEYGEIGEYLLSNKPSSGYTTEGLVSAYYNGLALIRSELGHITPGEALLEYSAYSEVDYSRSYAPLSEGEKSSLKKLFTGNHGVKGSFSDVYSDLALASEMINSASFDSLQEKYLAYARSEGISLYDYNRLPTDYSRDKVFISAFEDIKDAGSMADIRDIFNSQVAAQGNSASSGGSGGSGGGGGSSGSGGSGGGGAVYVPIEAPVPGSAFTDTKGHWAEEYIASLKTAGVVNGFEDGSFGPDNTVSRAEFVKMVCTMLGIAPSDGDKFADVGASDWHKGYVYAAYNAGIINGTDENKFSPDSPITRQDAAVIISRARKLSGGGSLTFADSHKVSPYAQEAVKSLSSAGIIGGYEDNTFRPLAQLTRGETAAILCRVQTIG